MNELELYYKDYWLGYNGDNSGDIDFSAPVEVYNLQGVFISDRTDGLVPGFYIVCQGKNVRKIAIN